MRRRLAMTLALSASVAACGTSAPPGWTWAPPSGEPGASPPTLATPSQPIASSAPTPGGLEPDPNAPIVHPRDPTAPVRLAGETHAIDLVIDERHNTLATGFVREVWAFGGTVPGPVIRVQAGDTLRIHLVNHPPALPGRAAWMHPAVNSNDHSVDFPAAMVGPHAATAPIEPGEERVYEFVAQHAGVWMYGCGAEPALEHLANGMFGMVIVEPAGGLERVDRELFLVRSEWYLGGPQQSAPMAKVTAAVPAPDFVVLNGIADQYVDHPILVRANERIRLFLLDAGPNLATALHLEGADPSLDGGAGFGRVVNLNPGEGAIVEFTLPRDGMYPLVDAAYGADGGTILARFRAEA